MPAPVEPFAVALASLDQAQREAVGGLPAVALLGRWGARLRSDAVLPRLEHLARRLELPGRAQEKLSSLLHPLCLRVRGQRADPARGGRPRLLLFSAAQAWLALERVLDGILERGAVVLHADGAAALELFELLAAEGRAAGLPPSQLQLVTGPLGDAQRDTLARRGDLLIEGDPALTARVGGPAGPLPRSTDLFPALGEAGQLRWLQQTVAAAAGIGLYRERFTRAGILGGTLPDWDTFRALPLTELAEVRTLGPPASDALLAAPFTSLESACVFGTGGTTGTPKCAVYSIAEWDEVTDLAAQQLALDGLTPADRVANLFYPGRLWSAFLAIDSAIRKLGCFSLPLGGDMEAAQLARFCRDLQATALVGTPSVLLRLAHAVEATGIAPRPRHLIFAGEHLSRAAADHLRRVFSAEAISSVAYSAIDAGVIGFQPAPGAGTVYHSLDNHALIEICDDRGRPVAVGEEGNVVVTNHVRRLFPVIRLRTGDLARRLEGGRFELLGRADDRVRAGMANIYLSDIEKLCAAFPDELAPLFQVRLSQQGVDDRYDLVIETQRRLSEPERAALTSRVRDAYLREAEAVASALRGGLLRHFVIDLQQPGGIPTMERTGKVRRLVDSRTPGAPAAPPAVAAHGRIEQSFLYSSKEGGEGWLRVVANPAYQDAPETLPLGPFAARIGAVAPGPLEVVGLGCGDATKEVRLVEALAAQRPGAVRRLRLIEVGEVLATAAQEQAQRRLGPLGIEVAAECSDFRDLPGHIAAWAAAGPPPLRAYCMFGGTFSNLDDELAFAREGLGNAHRGDLLLLDVSPAFAPADHPEEVARLDPRLSALGPTGLRPPELEWLRAALTSHLGDERAALAAEVRVRMNTACCPVPGSYAIELFAVAGAPGRPEREISLMYIKRYELGGLISALGQVGWESLRAERGAGRGLVVLLEKR